MPNYKVKLDVSKLDKSAFFKGAKGTYVDLVLWENRDGEDQYGNTHSVKQDLGKDRRDEKTPYVGNAKPIGGGGRDRTPQDGYRQGSSAARDNGGSTPGFDDDSDIPFAPFNPEP